MSSEETIKTVASRCGNDPLPQLRFIKKETKYNMKKIQLAVLAISVGLTMQARATLFDVTFTSNDGLTIGAGVLNGSPEGGGIYAAVNPGSYFDVFASINIDAGLYNLIQNPNSPNQS